MLGLGYSLVLLGNLAALWRRAYRRLPVLLEAGQLTISVAVGLALFIQLMLLEVRLWPGAACS